MDKLEKAAQKFAKKMNKRAKTYKKKVGKIKVRK